MVVKAIFGVKMWEKLTSGLMSLGVGVALGVAPRLVLRLVLRVVLRYFWAQNNGLRVRSFWAKCHTLARGMKLQY